MQLFMKTEIMPLSHLSSAPVGGEKEITKGFGKAFSRNYNTSAQKHNPWIIPRSTGPIVIHACGT